MFFLEIAQLLFISLSLSCMAYRNFRDKATFHNGNESDRAITRYIIQDVTRRIKLDHFRLPAAKFDSLWVHPELCWVFLLILCAVVKRIIVVHLWRIIVVLYTVSF